MRHIAGPAPTGRRSHRLRAAVAKRRLSRFEGWLAGQGQRLLTGRPACGQGTTQQLPLGVLLNGKPVLAGELLDLLPVLGGEAQQDLRASFMRAVCAGRRGHDLIIDQRPRYLASGAPVIARYRMLESGITARARDLALPQTSPAECDLGAGARWVQQGPRFGCCGLRESHQRSLR